MIRESILGALAGAAATVPMTGAMKLAHRRLPWHEQYPLPPRQITMKAAKMAGIRKHLDEPKRRGMTLAAHYGYGAAMGAIFGVVSGRSGDQDPMRGVGKGVAFGLAVWTASYLGLLPALGILKPATQHPVRRNLVMIGAHAVWGASLACLYRTACTTIPEDDERAN